MAKPIRIDSFNPRVFNFSQIALVPVEDIKELKERVEKVKEYIREYHAKKEKDSDMADALNLIDGIETELAGIEFPEE